MGILIKKLQQGGGIFTPRTMDIGLGESTAFLQRAGQDMVGGNSSYGSGTRRHGKTAQQNEADLLKSGLNSDITYYQTRKQELQEDMSAMLEADPNADQTAEYQQKAMEYHKLNTEFLPSIKNWAKLYSTSKTAFGNAKAANAPAIVGDEAIVYDNKEKVHKLVDTQDLIHNADNYTLLTAGDVLTRRAESPEFNGASDLGKAAINLINNAYGQANFDKTVQGRVKGAGYVWDNGRWVSPNNILSLQGNIISEAPGRTKTNAYNLNMLKNDIINSDPNARSYLHNLAVMDLYNRARTTEKDLTEASPEQIDTLVEKGAYDKLDNRLTESLFVNYKGGDKGKEGELSSFDMKDIYRNDLALATLRLDKNRRTVEVPGVTKGSTTYNYLVSTPTSDVNRGKKFLMEYGYKQFSDQYNKKDVDLDDLGDKNPLARKSMRNNAFVQEAKGSYADVTTVDGTPIEDLVTDKNEDFITIAPDSSLQVLLAPVEIDENGRERVNFNSAQKQKIDNAIREAYAELDKLDISPEDIYMGRDRKRKALAESIINKKLVDNGVDPSKLKVKMVLAFDVLFEVDSDKKGYRYKQKATDEEAKYLNAVNDDVWERRVRRTKVFVPISDSFYSQIFSKNRFGSDFDVSYKVHDYKGMLKNKNESEYNPGMQATAILKQQNNATEPQTAERAGVPSQFDVHAIFN